jgi:folate-dependent phosphoribosylglycinamide formyltransferase PurN
MLDREENNTVNAISMPPGLDPVLSQTLSSLCPGARARSIDGSRWGMLVEAPQRPPSLAEGRQAPLRLVLFGSFWIGHAALRAALAYRRQGPGGLALAGVVTDDPISPGARISLKKRAWSLMTEEERLAVKCALVQRALAADTAVFTGEIKTPGFRRLLAEWRPDAIITCGFGQVLDRAILDAAPYGAYNCHPTDLRAGHGAGPSPWADMTARGVHHTRWSVHQMTEVVDAGPVIGQTPPINVGDPMGRLPDDNRAFFYKVVPAVGWMVIRLIDALVERRAAGLQVPLATLDLETDMPPGLRRRIAAPILPDWQAATIPEPGADEFAALRGGGADLPLAAAG